MVREGDVPGAQKNTGLAPGMETPVAMQAQSASTPFNCFSAILVGTWM